MIDLWRLGQILDTTARILRDEGPTAQRLAPELAARGWPASTMGARRSNEPSSSVESDVLRVVEFGDPWEGIDRRLVEELRALERAARAVQVTVRLVASHGSDEDRPNRSVCAACSTVVGGYLRRGLCDRCRKQLERSGLDRAVWIASVRTDRSTEPGDESDAARFGAARGRGSG